MSKNLYVLLVIVITLSCARNEDIKTSVNISTTLNASINNDSIDTHINSDLSISRSDMDNLWSREQIKNYVLLRSQSDLEQMITLAREGGNVPENLFFLIIGATKICLENNVPIPDKWDARTVLNSFVSRQEVFEAIESYYREEIFSGLSLQSRGMQITLRADVNSLQERIGHRPTTEDRNQALQQTLVLLNDRIERLGITAPVIKQQGENEIYLELYGNAYSLLDINKIILGRGSLTFQLMDDEVTEIFNTSYNNNPGNTFNTNGELINPAIIPRNTLMLGVYHIDNYGLEEQGRNSSGNPDFVAVSREVGLDGNHIRSAEVKRSSPDERPIITFTLDPECGEIFYKLTSENIGRTMAIILENRVRSQATIRSPIRDAVSLDGFGMEEANNIAQLMNTPVLPVELRIIEQKY